jgi:hypothetical protein
VSRGSISSTLSAQRLTLSFDGEPEWEKLTEMLADLKQAE